MLYVRTYSKKFIMKIVVQILSLQYNALAGLQTKFLGSGSGYSFLRLYYVCETP